MSDYQLQLNLQSLDFWPFPPRAQVVFQWRNGNGGTPSHSEPAYQLMNGSVQRRDDETFGSDERKEARVSEYFTLTPQDIQVEIPAHEARPLEVHLGDADVDLVLTLQNLRP